MEQALKNRISQLISVFHGRVVPETGGLLVGYAALSEAYKLAVPLPERLAVISHHHRRYDTDT